MTPAFRFKTLTTLLVSGVLVAASGCSVLDPNRVIMRGTVPSPVSTTPVPMPNSNWRAEAIDFVWTTVNERYYDPKLNGVDWTAVRARYEPRLLAAKSDDEFWELLDKMTGELKDSHTRVHSPKLVEQQRNGESHSLGLGFIELNGEIVVTTVNPASDAWWAGARAGMSIKTIDGNPALAYYQKLVAESRDTSTPWARTRGAVRKINSGDVGTVVSMTFVRSDKTEFDVEMKRRKFPTPPEYVARVLPSGIGYVRFSGFVASMEGGIIAEIARMKDTPGMIIDIRNNGGGSGAMAKNILSRFYKEKQSGLKTLTRTGKPITVLFVPITKMVEDMNGVGPIAYTKPVVVLTNESSASASEIFSVVMKETGRATLIGQRTCGCLLGYFGLADIPGGGQMAYSEIGFIAKNGFRIEGDGVKPDIEVNPSREDYLLGRDRVLERAVAHLLATPAQAPTPAVSTAPTKP